jgi:hypothetical protein
MKHIMEPLNDGTSRMLKVWEKKVREDGHRLETNRTTKTADQETIFLFCGDGIPFIKTMAMKGMLRMTMWALLHHRKVIVFS